MAGRLFTKQRQLAIAEVIARDGQATVDALCSAVLYSQPTAPAPIRLGTTTTNQPQAP